MFDKTVMTLLIVGHVVSIFSPNTANYPARAESLDRINHYLENNFTLE